MTCEITGLSSMATRLVLAELAGSYEQRTGCLAAIVSMGGVEAARLVRAGEPTDVVVLASDVIRQLESEGHLLAGSRIDFARSGIAIAVRAGASRPNIQDEEAVKQAILAARKISYSTGPSGNHLQRLWTRWGLADAVAERIVQAPPGVPVGALVARGDADLGFQQLSELMNVPGIEVLGPMPPEIQSVTVFSAAVSRATQKAEEARSFAAYLASPDTAEVKRKNGMEPA
jgi:molybdate transport system substrate-binding protein